MLKLKEKKSRDMIAKAGLRIADVAAAIGVSDSHFRNVIAGRKGLGFKFSKRLIEMFGASRMNFVIDWNAMKILNPLESEI